MADDHNSRYRPDDQYGRSSVSGLQGNDPLAELARLIGQNDPFAEYGRKSGAAAPHETGYDQQPPHYDQQQHHQYDQQLHYGQESVPQYSEQAAPQYGHDQPQAHGHEPAPYPVEQAPGDWNRAQQAYDQFAHAIEQSLTAPDPRQDKRVYAAPEQAARVPDAHTYAHQGQTLAQPAADPFPAAPAFAHAAAPGPEPQPFPSSPPPFYRPDAPPADDFYDDAPQGRRKGLLTVMAVLCLAVLGTAGAFAYRSIFVGPSVSPTPPIIRASTEPNRVAPPPPAVDAMANKLSYDRFGDRGQNEQVVLREEQPLDQREFARSVPPRVVLQNGNSPSAPAVTASANPPSVLTEPKRVRTVPIRPGEPDAGRPQSMAAAVPVPPVTPAAPPPRQTVVASAPANTPLDVSPQAAAVSPQAAAPTRSIPPRMVQPAPPPANAPLSLAPDAASPPPAVREAAQPRARLASVPSTGGGSGYHVQVSSQRSEADAQSSFRSLRAKYSGVLGDREPVIRRADLGEKGTYYRAMVGPFSTREQAVQLCGSLKAAGGDCVVQSN